MQTFHWLWVLFVLVMIFIALLQGLKEYLHNEKQPKTTSVAKVLMIDRKDSKIILNQTLNMSMVYHITFKIENGETKKITVPVYGNQWIKEGTEGILTFQGTRFISFKKIEQV